MLAVKSVFDHRVRWIQLIYDEVGVVLKSRCEHNNLKVVWNFIQKRSAVWSYTELLLALVEMDKSFIEV